jgi:hypothetical protein
VNKKVLAVGLLAGGIGLTGLAGSAYAEGPAAAKAPAKAPAKTPAKAPAGLSAVAVKGHGPTAVVCYGTAGSAKFKGEILTKTGKGKLPPLPKPPAGKTMIKVRGGKVVSGPAGAEGVTVVRDKNGRTTVTVGTPPKGLPKPPPGPPPKGGHCTTVKPGTPGAPPPLPTR